MQILKPYEELMVNEGTALYLDLNGQTQKVKIDYKSGLTMKESDLPANLQPANVC